MTKQRKPSLKPCLYLGGASLSLFALTHYLEPILELTQRGWRSTIASDLVGNSSGLDVEALGRMISDAQPDGADKSEPAQPRQIIVKDVRTIDGPAVEIRDRFTQATTLQNQKQFPQAEAIYLELLAADPRNAAVHRNLAVLYCQMKNYEQSWVHVHALESLGQSMPAAFIGILEASMPDP